MKKTIFLILSTLFSVASIGQIPKSEVVEAVMPAGAKQLTKEQLSTFVHSNYKKSTIPLDRENIYQLDGLLIGFWDLSVNPEFKKSLEDTQSEMLGYLKWTDKNTIDYSKIVTVNNVRFLVTEYQKADEVYLWFASDYDKSNQKISGVIQFKEPDKDNADKALNDFLQTVHFKNM